MDLQRFDLCGRIADARMISVPCPQGRAQQTEKKPLVGGSVQHSLRPRKDPKRCDDETPSGQRPIRRVGQMQKKSWCMQAPRVETTQGLPLVHETRSIQAEKTLSIHLSEGRVQRNAAHPAERKKKKVLGAHVSGWNCFHWICLTAHQQEKELCVRASLLCVVEFLSAHRWSECLPNQLHRRSLSAFAAGHNCIRVTSLVLGLQVCLRTLPLRETKLAGDTDVAIGIEVAVGILVACDRR